MKPFTITLVVPDMPDRLLGRMIKEVELHYPLLLQYGVNAYYIMKHGYQPPKLRVHKFVNYDVDLPKHDIIVQCETHHQVKHLMVPAKWSEENINSMLLTNHPSEAIVAKMGAKETNCHRAILFAMGELLGITIPGQHFFKTPITPWVYQMPSEQLQKYLE